MRLPLPPSGSHHRRYCAQGPLACPRLKSAEKLQLYRPVHSSSHTVIMTADETVSLLGRPESSGRTGSLRAASTLDRSSLNTHSIAALLEAEERRCIEATPQGAINCKRCQDFRTDVSHGREHPCRHCQPLRFKVWRLCEATAEDMLLVSVNGVDCLVILPPDGGPNVQPCEGLRCDQGCTFVRPVDDAGGAFWAEVTDLEITTPWSGV